MNATPLLALLLTGCGVGLHHQYDHGRAYQAAFDQQADLERESAQDAAFALSGVEGLALRALVQEATTDEEKAETVQDTE